MELDLRLGHATPKPIFSSIDKTHSKPPVQLDLLPPNPVHHHSPPPHQLRLWPTRENVKTDRTEEGQDAASPNFIAISSINSKFSRVRKGNRSLQKQLNLKVEAYERGKEGGTFSRGSDEEENVLGRKKLRLSKEQSAFLEESFKEHHTLNPREKLVLAKQLSLRPRQVEVWFQNRRARTKLKQTEVDCEYLKRRCETLREENKKLQRELQELRALNNNMTNNSNIILNPFLTKLQATTLTICPSCERISSLAC